MRHPAGPAIDAVGNLYVADVSNDRIEVFDADDTFVARVGIAWLGQRRVWYPADVALDAAGNVYVADTFNNRVQVFDVAGEFIRGWGRTGPARVSSTTR